MEADVDHAIVLFDGVCNLCNAGVDFVLSRDRRGVFKLASLQSEAGQALLRRHGLPTSDFRSFVLLEGDRVSERSTAALRVARRLGGPWALLSALALVPRPLRDAVYDLVARHRVRWFGRRASCRLPTPEEAGRFLSDPEPQGGR